MIIKAGMILKPGARITIAPGSGDAIVMYRFNSDTGTILEYLGGGSSPLIIPDTIGGVPVTIIGNGAFVGCAEQVIILPLTVTTLGDGAFANSVISCITPDINYILTGLADLTQFSVIPTGILSTSNITKIVLSSYTTVGSDAFKNTHLTEITIGSYCTLNSSADTFGSNHGFQSVYDSSTTATYRYQNGQWIGIEIIKEK